MDTILNILSNSVEEAIAPTTAGLVIAVIGLNIHFGFTGLMNIGQAGFMLLGAYGMAISITQGLGMFLAVVVGLLVAVVFAFILGAPTLKLRGDYLAIVTISAAEIIRYVGRLAALEPWTGGSQGIFGKSYQPAFVKLSFFGDGSFTLLPVNYKSLGLGTAGQTIGLLLLIAVIVALVMLAKAMRTGEGTLAGLAANRTVARVVMTVLGVLTFVLMFFVFPVSYGRTGTNGWWVRAVAWFFVGVSLLITWLLVRSPWGRALKGVREDEEAMRSLGKNVYVIKMQALIIGGMFGAFGGMVYVISQSVQADAMGRQLTFFAYTALLLGGAAAIFGPVLGTTLFFGARILIRGLAAAYIPNSIMGDQQTEQFSYIVVGVGLMLLVIFRPQGILGNKRELRFNV
ncbi:branched-chain amino acid ABC transporter permease [Nocardioides sp. GY 10127]|uniref:branched-chain amino acid ABC transporter permease n=1 Tax=Nocardioides sp. GY 10127 TaxID=2569762 RepID=UPI0010A80467|nr:branched-chain amino acid ABC transporter permease [Nocardioides sp. GY 10127]TIC81021.1 branched-chain amino acid ABC transporter permease [Nocardioides sp. GY 10127]